MTDIRFSIVITCHNQHGFIQDAVNSALSLGYGGKEIIVVDDGSTDGSQEILRGYKDSIRFAPLENNRGASRARNYGASLATGDYVVFLDGDDVFLPWALNVYGQLVEQKKPKVILSRLLVFEGSLPTRKEEDAPREIRFVDYESVIKKDRAFWASASTIVVDRNAFEEVKGWSNDIFPLEDLDLITKLGYSGRTIQILFPPAIYYRVHVGNTVNEVAPFVSMIEKIVQKVRAGEYPGGPGGRFERYAFLGGPFAFWVARTLRSHMYQGCAAIIVCGWPMMIAKIVSKLKIVMRKRPVEVMQLETGNV